MNSTKLLIILFLLIQPLSVAMTNNLNIDNNRLVLLPVKSDPSISLKIWFKVGSQNDPVGKEGLAALTAQMLTEGGTTNNSYDQILDKLFPLAASYQADLSTEMTVFEGRTHKDNLDVYYSLFVDQLLNPNFKEEDFNRLKNNLLNYLNTTLKYSSDEELGKAILYNEIFDGTRYAHVLQGTISGLNNLTIDDVKNFYKKYFNRNNFVIGVGGGYDEKLVKKLWTDLQKLPEGEERKVEVPSPKKIEGLNVTIVDKNTNATAISFGFPINILRNHSDWYALALANSWFGEHRNSSSHLYQVIREQRGLNYGDYSYIENFPLAGRRTKPPTNVSRRQQIFEVWIRPVPNDAKHFTLRAAVRELEKIVENGLSQDAFDQTRKFLQKYVLHYASTTSEKLGYAIDDKFYGMNGSHLKNFRDAMSKVTLEEVNNAIKKHLQYENMEIVFVTNNGQKLKDDLAANAPSPIQYSSPKAQSILDEDKFIVNYKLPIKMEKIEILTVEDLFK